MKFTDHNIRLDDGTCTISDSMPTMDKNSWCVAAMRVLETVFPNNRESIRVADLGCLEGGYAVEFARMGFDVTGIEVRESNIDACQFVKSRISLPNLKFIQDDAWNIAKHGQFDAVFCCGLLYHIDRPRAFLQAVSAATTKLLMVQTHFSRPPKTASFIPYRWQQVANQILAKLKLRKGLPYDYVLSPVCENEGVPGQWYPEFGDDTDFTGREAKRWASWDNRKSFWIQREYLLQIIKEIGFSLVAEQFDGLTPTIAESLLHGYHYTHMRSTFIGVKTSYN